MFPSDTLHGSGSCRRHSDFIQQSCHCQNGTSTGRPWKILLVTLFLKEVTPEKAIHCRTLLDITLAVIDLRRAQGLEFQGMSKRKLFRLVDETFWFNYGSPTAAVVICILNGIEIYILSRRCRKQTLKYNKQKISLILLLNLAISDFLVGFAVILIKILFYLFKHDVIAFTHTASGIYGFILFYVLRTSLLCSVLNLMVMTFDRYSIVLNPVQYYFKWHRRHIGLIIAMIWIVPVSLVSGHYYLYVVKLPEKVGLKFEEVIFPATILPTCVAFVCCYINIIQNIYKRGQIRKASMESKRYTFEREKRVTKFAGSIVLLFMVCWLPLAALGIVKATGKKIAYTFADLIFNLALYNSVGNPLIYFWFKQNVWKKIRNCKVFPNGG